MRAGYQRIGLDHYARPGDALCQVRMGGKPRQYFQGYTGDPADAPIGFGASSIGQWPPGYVQNVSDIKGWSHLIEADERATARGLALTQEDRLRGVVIERPMFDLRVDIPAVSRQWRFAAEYLDPEPEALEPPADDGLARIDRRMITVPEPASNLVRRVASVFEAYPDPAAGRHAVAV